MQLVTLGRIVNRYVFDPGVASLLRQLGDVVICRQGDDFDFIRQVVCDLECRAADRAGGT